MQALQHPWPARMDTFHAFASYPTHTLSRETVLGLCDGDFEAASSRLAQYQRLSMVEYAKIVWPVQEEIAHVLRIAASGPQRASALIEALPRQRQPFVLRSLVWMVKLGILKRYA